MIPREGFLQRRLGGRRLGGAQAGWLEDGGEGPWPLSTPALASGGRRPRGWRLPGHEGLALLREALMPR